MKRSIYASNNLKHCVEWLTCSTVLVDPIFHQSRVKIDSTGSNIQLDCVTFADKSSCWDSCGAERVHGKRDLYVFLDVNLHPDWTLWWAQHHFSFQFLFKCFSSYSILWVSNALSIDIVLIQSRVSLLFTDVSMFNSYENISFIPRMTSIYAYRSTLLILSHISVFLAFP